MKRFALAALAAGVITASCSGHGGSALPTTPAGSGTPGTMGVHGTRASATAVNAPVGFAATATQAAALSGVSDKGALPASQSLTIRVALQLHNVDQLKQSIAAGQITARSAFMATYAPTASEVAQVKNYLQTQGFTNVNAEANNILVDATGTVATVDKAFSTQIESYGDASGANLYANTKPAYVPQAISGLVVAVLGLNDAQMQKPRPKNAGRPHQTATPTPAPSPDACTQGVNAEGICPRFYDPGTMQLVYDAANAPTGARTSVAIFTEGDVSQAVSDFRWNERVYTMPQVPVNVIHAEPMTSDTSGNGEWTLDMTAVQGLAANLKRIDLYNFASLSDSDIVTAYNKWATDDTDPVGNSSFGGCEVFPYQDGAMLAADEVLAEAASQGQTMFVSSGDNGGYCNNFVDTNGAPGGAPMVEWPAASPYVVAVGGTDLFSNADGSVPRRERVGSRRRRKQPVRVFALLGIADAAHRNDAGRIQLPRRAGRRNGCFHRNRLSRLLVRASDEWIVHAVHRGRNESRITACSRRIRAHAIRAWKYARIRGAAFLQNLRLQSELERSRRRAAADVARRRIPRRPLGQQRFVQRFAALRLHDGHWAASTS